MHRQPAAPHLSGYIQIMLRKLVPLLALLALSGGCQNIPGPATTTPQAEKKLPAQTETTYGSAGKSVQQLSSTVVALVDTANRQAASGETANASRTLERALRIEPRNARLWNELAHLYYRDDLYIKAANTAAKSNSLAGSDADLRYDNWRLIARARKKTGDADGASIAEENALRYR